MMLVGRSDIPEPQDDADVASAAISNLRILFVIDSRFPGLGGAEHQAVKLAQALKARGVAVEYIAPRVLEEGGHDGPELDGIPLTYIDYPHIKLVGSIVLMCKFAAFLMKNREQFDCMHVHVTRLLAATAGVVRPYSKIPIITKISGFFEFEGGVLDQRKRYYPLNAVLRLALRNIDYVQTISEETREKLLSSGFRENQIALIPNGIDTSEPPSALPESDVFTIGYCGRLREVKGVHVLLDAFAHTKKTRATAPIKLKLAGSGIAEDDLKAQAKKLGIDDDVDFIGTIEDTASFYQSLNLYVQPSFAEGLPNSVIEAMHAGRAVLATDIGGNHDLIEDNVSGRLFPAGDHEKLSQLILDCYDDQDDNVRMGNNGRGVIEADYGMDTVIDKLVGVYSEQ